MGKEGFETVQSSSATWNPKQTGSKKGNDFVALEANDKSYVVGFYLGMKTNVGSNNSNIHELQFKEAGDKNHFGEEVKEGDKVSVWGSGVLDNMIAEGVQPGQLIMITWLGLLQPKKAGGNNYHGWEVGVNKSVEPIKADAAMAIPDDASTSTKVPSGSENTEEEEDDLPF